MVSPINNKYDILYDTNLNSRNNFNSDTQLTLVSGSTGTAAYLAQNSIQNYQVRYKYLKEIAKLNPQDNEARAKIKQNSRSKMAQPQKKIVEITRPCTKANPCSVDGATRSNSSWNKVCKITGVVGASSGVIALAIGSTIIASSDNKAKATTIVASSAGGGITGGIAGAKIGVAIGSSLGLLPGAVIGGIIGGVFGSIFGGITGGKIGEIIYNKTINYFNR